jgi:hypothetical protein
VIWIILRSDLNPKFEDIKKNFNIHVDTDNTNPNMCEHGIGYGIEKKSGTYGLSIILFGLSYV